MTELLFGIFSGLNLGLCIALLCLGVFLVYASRKISRDITLHWIIGLGIVFVLIIVGIMAASSTVIFRYLYSVL